MAVDRVRLNVGKSGFIDVRASQDVGADLRTADRVGRELARPDRVGRLSGAAMPALTDFPIRTITFG